MSIFKKLFAKKNEEPFTYKDFWTWFTGNERLFREVVLNQGDIEKLFFDKLAPKLHQINPELYFLTGRLNEHAVELIITADGAIKNIVFAEELVAAAPVIPGWKFTASKPASGDDFAINMAGYNFGCNNLSFYVNEDERYPDEIDLNIVYDDYQEADKTSITNGVYIFLDNYLGELESADMIDNLTVTGKQEAGKEMIPITKLKAYLNWRQKEFLEKYEGTRHNTEEDSYSLLEATLPDGKPLVAAVNTGLLAWDAKASHRWIADVMIKYKSNGMNGMPDSETSNLLNEIEDTMMESLSNHEGYLNVGRETADSTRHIYLACKDFRKPSKVLADLQKRYQQKLDISYDFYKDKYWRSFNKFVQH